MTPERFKKIRGDKSQFEIAIKLNVSQGQISIWEKGYREIPEVVADEMEELNNDN